MHRFKNQLLLAAGFAVLAGIISGITAAPAIAQAIKAALVKNVDEPGRIPFMRSSTCSTTTSNSCNDVIFSVPANKRLVVEHISMLSTAANAMRIPEVIFITGASSFTSRAFVLSKLDDSGPATSRYSVNEPLRFYADAGEVINVVINYHQVGTSDNQFTISGYLVDLAI